jgi:hypothetical protein
MLVYEKIGIMGPNIYYDIIKLVLLGFYTMVGAIYNLSLLAVPP